MSISLAKLGLMAVLAVAVSGCGLRDRITGNSGNRFVALPYEARITDGETDRSFVVTVEAVGASLTAARESARFPATRYCIDRTGSSEIDWVFDPATGDWMTQRTEDGDLIVRGSCAER